MMTFLLVLAYLWRSFVAVFYRLVQSRRMLHRYAPLLPISASTSDSPPQSFPHGEFSEATISWQVQSRGMRFPNVPNLQIFQIQMQPLFLGLVFTVIAVVFDCLNNPGNIPSEGLHLVLYQVYAAVLIFLLFWVLSFIAKLAVSGASPGERVEARRVLLVPAFLFMAFLLKFSLQVSFFRFLGVLLMSLGLVLLVRTLQPLLFANRT